MSFSDAPQSMPITFEKMKTMDKTLEQRGVNQYPSGLAPSENPVAIYGPPSSDNPTLIIANPIYDYYGDVITPGYYELELSYDKTIFKLTQKQNLIATFPVIKYQDNRSPEDLKQTMDSKSLKKQEKMKKKAAKKKKHDLEAGKYAFDPETYTNASMTFDEKKGYYLVKYERGKIEAWGALKPEF